MRKTLLALTLALAIPFSAEATTFSFTSGSLAASADFSVVGGQLKVVLTNTSTADVLVPVNILTAVFFNVTGTLAPVSALVNNGSSVVFGSGGAGTNVGGEWAYASGLSGAPGGATSGISSTGLGLFGQPNFNGPNLQGPTAVDGMQYGILSAGDLPTTGNTPVTGTNAFVKNSVVFLLSIPAGFNISSITNVTFQYGTSLSDFNSPDGGTTAALLGLSMLALGFVKRFKR